MPFSIGLDTFYNWIAVLHVFFHNYAKAKIHSDDDLTLENTMIA